MLNINCHGVHSQRFVQVCQNSNSRVAHLHECVLQADVMAKTHQMLSTLPLLLQQFPSLMLEIATMKREGDCQIIKTDNLVFG